EDMPELKISFVEQTHVAVTDAYGPLKDGKPSKVTRSYEKLGGTSTQKVELPEGMDAQGDPNEEKERSSELEGKSVVFKLDDDGESYKADFADGKGDAKLLEDLEEDMDLRGFLPRGDVTEDKSWEIEAKVFNSVLGAPGGDLKIDTQDDKEDDSDIDQQFEDNLKGKGKGTYKGKREVDGHHCAVIALEAELKTTGKDDKTGAGGHDGVKSITLEYTVEGELLWDVDEGHFHKCTLSSKIRMKMQDSLSMETDEGKHAMQQTVQ